MTNDILTKPQHEGQPGALAPLDKEPIEPPKFEVEEELQVYFLKLWEKCEKINEPEWLALKQQMVRAQNYVDGKQWGYVNDKCQWIDYEKRQGEVTHTDNVYQPHVQTALMEMTRGSTALSFSYAVPNSRKGGLVANVSETLYKKERRKTFDVPKTQQENLSLLLNGVAYRYTYFCWNTDAKQKNPVFGEREELGESVEVCAQCMKPKAGTSEEPAMPMPEMGEAMAEPMAETDSPTTDLCPNCGSDEFKTISAPTSNAQVITGYENGKSGCNGWVSPDPLGITHYLHATSPKESPYWLWKQGVLRDVLQAQYPDIPISKEGIKSRELAQKFEYQSGTPNVQDLMGDRQADSTMTEFEQGWFDLPLYQHYVLKKAVKLRNGMEIPAGTKLGEAFPDGLYIAKNGKIILDLWNENKCDKWTASPYVTRKGTMIGAGTSIALDKQDMLNDVGNLIMASVMNDAYPKEFVNATYLEPENIPNSPTERAVITNLPEGGKIVGNVIDRLPAAQLSPDAYALTEAISGSIQMGMGTFSGNQAGAPDLKAVQNTASGFLAWRNMTVGRFAPMLEMKADCLDKQQAMQFLKNIQKHYTPEQWEKYKGDFGAEAVKAFLECDLDDDLIIEVVPESFMPQTNTDRQAKFMAFAEFITAMQMSPDNELAAEMADVLGIPKSLVSFDAEYSAAMQTIDSFKVIADMIAEEIGDIPTFNLQDPTAAQMAQLIIMEADAEISPEMDAHEPMIEAYLDWWNKDEGRSASNVLKAAVSMRVQEHKQAVVTKTQNDQMLMMEAQAPQMAMQEAIQQEQMAQQQGQAEQQMAQEAQGKQAEQQNGQMQAEQQSAEKQADRDFQMQMTEREAIERDKDRNLQREIATQKQSASK